MYCALLTLAWLVGTIYATIPLFTLIVRPFAKFLRARRFTASRNHPVLVRHDGSRLFADLAMARGRFVQRTGRVAGGGFPLRCGHSHLLSLAPALLSHPSRGAQRTGAWSRTAAYHWQHSPTHPTSRLPCASLRAVPAVLIPPLSRVARARQR